MRNRWNDEEPSGLSPIDQLIYQSRLVGSEESLVLWGGGNNSIKRTGGDPLGNPIAVMDVKGSGSDMKTIVAAQFPAVRLDWILPLVERESMSDEEMVEFLARCLLDPKMPRPSIETLLHAFLPFPAVLHTHADAILALTNNQGREETVRAAFGDEVILNPYLRPGFAMSRMVAEAVAARPDARGLVLMNHGLLTWGATPKEAYERHIELVSRAEEHLAGGSRSGPRSEIAPPSSDLAAEIALLLRGELSAEKRVVLRYDGSPEALRFAARPDLDELLMRGPATPDHLLHTGRFPAVVRVGEGSPADAVRRGIEAHRARYERYFRANAGTGAEAMRGAPRIVVAPGVGIFAAGKDARATRVIRDIFAHTRSILESAEVAGGYETLDDREMFRGEYWPLELYKLTLLPKERELAGRVALVTGAAHGIGRAIARRLAAEGAHVLLADLDLESAGTAAAEIVKTEGIDRAVAVRADVTKAASVAAAFRDAILRWGGIDLVVSNAGVAKVGLLEELDPADWERSLAVNATGHFHVTREALRAMKTQGRGGSIVYNATKNVTAPGASFGAYSVSKAAEAQLCRIAAIEGAAFGIRANMVNPDAVFEGSKLWEEIGGDRAAAHGIAAADLEEFYRKRNLLQVRVRPEDVAEAVLFLASDRSSRTTGAMIPVDGGVREAFPR